MCTSGWVSCSVGGRRSASPSPGRFRGRLGLRLLARNAVLLVVRLLEPLRGVRPPPRPWARPWAWWCRCSRPFACRWPWPRRWRQWTRPRRRRAAAPPPSPCARRAGPCAHAPPWGVAARRVGALAVSILGRLRLADERGLRQGARLLLGRRRWWRGRWLGCGRRRGRGRCHRLADVVCGRRLVLLGRGFAVTFRRLLVLVLGEGLLLENLWPLRAKVFGLLLLLVGIATLALFLLLLVAAFALLVFAVAPLLLVLALVLLHLVAHGADALAIVVVVTATVAWRSRHKSWRLLESGGGAVAARPSEPVRVLAQPSERRGTQAQGLLPSGANKTWRAVVVANSVQ